MVMSFLKPFSVKYHVFWTHLLSVASHFSSSINFPAKNKNFILDSHDSLKLKDPLCALTVELEETVYSPVYKPGTPTLNFLLWILLSNPFAFLQPLIGGALPSRQTLRFLFNYSYFLCTVLPPTLKCLLQISILSSISFSFSWINIMDDMTFS